MAVAGNVQANKLNIFWLDLPYANKIILLTDQNCIVRLPLSTNTNFLIIAKLAIHNIVFNGKIIYAKSRFSHDAAHIILIMNL